MHDLEMVHGDLKGVCGDIDIGTDISLMTPSIQANILINQDCRACLADFGLSTVTGVQTRAVTGSFVSVLSNDSVMSFTHGGSIRWMSPELIIPQRYGVEGNRPTKMSDCYALGMVIYEVGVSVGDFKLQVLKCAQVLCGYVPYHDMPRGLAIMTAISEGVRPEKPENAMDLGFTEALWETVEKCWAGDRSARPDVKEILSCLSGTPLPRRAGRLTAGFMYKRILGAF